MYRTWRFISDYSALLIVGALAGLAWANLHPAGYHAFVDFALIDGGPIGHLHVDAEGHAHRTLTVHYLVNDVLMALFFAIAGKEVWEAVALRDGALRGRKAMTPLIATAGGMIGPAAVYLAGAAALGSFAALAHGWAIPTATDIAFSYLIGRLVFGAGHPAVMFLLLLAIADDAGGLVILAVFYPQGDLAPAWLLLSVGAAVAAWFFANWLPRRLDGDDPGSLARPSSGAGSAPGPTRWPGRSAGTASSRRASIRRSASCRSSRRSRMRTSSSASSRKRRGACPTFSTGPSTR